MTDPPSLPERIHAGVEALREGHPAAAVEALEPVAADPTFVARDDLVDVRARVYSLLAQALLGAGRARDADPWARDALDLVVRLGDRRGEAEILALQREIQSASTQAIQRLATERESRRIAQTPVDVLLSGARDPVEQAALLVKKANAEADAGREEGGASFARRALEQALSANALREEVLARLSVARCDRAAAEEELVAAWRRAEAADDFTLVGVVARAAELAGVALPVLHGPSTSESS
ncbi:MAG: hypothetical protein JRI25_17465 [Deltaproteobacteria bacterium]|nr:hypothetical protein [Deltaproteobacteria bacterium]MBW2256367.1 hypothetical protein [Deltaproteobacteria bacterium]